MEKETNENSPRFQDTQPLQSPDEIINNNQTDINDTKQKLTVKNCKFCAEEIKLAAILCRFCGRDQNQEQIVPQEEPDKQQVLTSVQNSLGHDETIIYQTKKSLRIFLTPVIFILFFLLTSFAASTLSQLPLILLTLIVITIRFWKYKNEDFIITNKRVILKNGILNKSRKEILIDKLESIDIKQSLLGQYFNYGDLILSGTGTTRDTYKKIKNPEEFRKILQNQSLPNK